MTHLAITEGGTEWGDHLTDEEYAGGPGFPTHVGQHTTNYRPDMRLSPPSAPGVRDARREPTGAR